MTSILKVCPGCSRKIHPKSAICRSCGHRFSAADQRAFEAQANLLGAEISQRKQKEVWGCLGLAGAFALILLIAQVVHQSTATPAELRTEKLAACFHGTEQKNFDLISKVKSTLRDPDSFEYIETNFHDEADGKIATAEMRYRARNGFGGLNVASVQANIDPNTCEATITGST